MHLFLLDKQYICFHGHIFDGFVFDGHILMWDLKMLQKEKFYSFCLFRSNEGDHIS